MKLIAISAIALLLVGCVGPLVEINETSSKPLIPVYAEAGSAPQHTIISEVRGYSCKNLAWDPPPSRGDALLQLTINADKLGADGVLDVKYFEEGFSVEKNCWSSITAEGKALAFKASE